MRSSILYTKLRPSILFHCTSLNGPRRWFHLLSCRTSPLGRSLHWLRGNCTMTLLPLSGPLRTVVKGDFNEHFYTVLIPHTKYSSLCILYFTPTQFQTCWKQTREIPFLSFLEAFSLDFLSSPTSLWFCCFSTACSWLDQDKETLHKPQYVHLTNAFRFPQWCQEGQRLYSMDVFCTILLKNVLFQVDLSHRS